MYLLWRICIGILAGFLAGKIMRGRGYGVLIDLLLGLVGSVVGGWMGSGERMTLNYSNRPHRQHGRAWGETR